MSLVLDAGALIAFDRGERETVVLLRRAVDRDCRIVVPAGVVGQTWRDGRRQARLARLLSASPVRVEPLDVRRAREAGQLCGARGTSDVIDASVVLAARAHGAPVLTSDADDLVRLDPTIACIDCWPAPDG